MEKGLQEEAQKTKIFLINHDLLENVLTDFSLISHTSCVG